MTYCPNPYCPNPQNLNTHSTCLACGFSLWLQNRYSILQLLGQGAVGRTFLAIDAQDGNTKCIIKQFLPQVAAVQEQAIALFQRNVQLLKALGEHPQIPNFIDAFEQAGQFYLVQAFIEGQNLAALMHERGTFSEAQIWQLLAELLPLLQFLQQQQVIHRDINPENIIQTPENQVFLVGFGAVMMTQAETLVGSPEYIAPEQALGKATYASDLYSLGVTCIHLLTEVSPFDLYDSLSDRWIWRSCLPQPVSDRLAQVLDKLIQHAVNLRFQTAEPVMQESGVRSQVAHRFKVQAQNLKSHAPLVVMLASGPVNAIALHPTAPILASAEDKAIGLWDMTTQQRLVTLSTKGERALVFNPDGTTLIGAGDDKTIRLWDWRSGEILTTLTGTTGAGHAGSVRSLALSPGGEMLASGSWDKTIRLWQLGTGERVQVLKHGLQVMAVAFSPDGQWLASASCDRTARLWRLGSLAQSKLNPPIILSGHAWAVLTVAFSPDSRILATGSEDNLVKLWDVQTGRLIQTLTGHSWAIAALGFSPDGKTLLSASWDKTIKLWEVASGALRATLVGHTDSVHAIVVCPSALVTGYEIFSGGRDRLICRWQGI